MSVLDKIKADFEAKRKQSVFVPEWDATVYWDALTARDRKAIQKGVADGDDGALIVSLLIHKLRDKDSKPIFDGDAVTRATLEGEADFEVLSRLYTTLSGKTSHDEEVEAAKNA